MSDQIKHECAVTLLRLRHGVDYYLRKYGTAWYGFQKLALMLENSTTAARTERELPASVSTLNREPPVTNSKNPIIRRVLPTCWKKSAKPFRTNHPHPFRATG